MEHGYFRSYFWSLGNIRSSGDFPRVPPQPDLDPFLWSTSWLTFFWLILRRHIEWSSRKNSVKREFMANKKFIGRFWVGPTRKPFKYCLTKEHFFTFAEEVTLSVDAGAWLNGPLHC